MKKILNSLIAVMLMVFLSGCNSEASTKIDATNGTYQAAGVTAANGWTQFVTFEIVDGQIKDLKLDGANLTSGETRLKSVLSEAGEYNLAPGNAGEWYVQTALIKEFVETNNGFGDATFDSEGKSDAISGATIKYGEFKTIIDAAIAAGPITKGTLVDGVKFAEDTADEKGFTYTVGTLVSNGIILAAHVDAYKVEVVDGKDTKQFKTVLSKEGTYNLPDTAVAPYHEQAEAVSKFILANQGLDVNINDDGKTDAISGATVSVDRWINLLEKAMK